MRVAPHNHDGAAVGAVRLVKPRPIPHGCFARRPSRVRLSHMLGDSPVADPSSAPSTHIARGAPHGVAHLLQRPSPRLRRLSCPWHGPRPGTVKNETNVNFQSDPSPFSAPLAVSATAAKADLLDSRRLSFHSWCHFLSTHGDGTDDSKERLDYIMPINEDSELGVLRARDARQWCLICARPKF